MKLRKFDINNPKTWPKDGQRVLAYGIWQSDINPKDDEPNWWICEIEMDPKFQTYPAFNVDGGTYYSTWLVFDSVTHWMSLPNNP